MEKEVRYIQLPPIPEDIEMPALEAIWLIARMNTEQRKDALAKLQAMLGDEEQTGKPDYEKVQAILDKYGEIEDESIFSQYIECFRNLLAGYFWIFVARIDLLQDEHNYAIIVSKQERTCEYASYHAN